MRLSDLDPAFIARLENWGLYYRDQYRPAQSVTYRVCQSVAAAKGKGFRDGYHELNPRPEIDEDDARIIERCWCQTVYRMDRKHHALLRAHYVTRVDKRTICRAMQIRLLSYDSELAFATMRFSALVQMLENYGETPTKKVVDDYAQRTYII